MALCITPRHVGALTVIISPLDGGDNGFLDFGLPDKEFHDLDVQELLAIGDFTEIDNIIGLFFPDEIELNFVQKRALLTSWYGEVEDDVGMANFNIINGRLTGSATFNNTIYHIYTAPTGLGRADGMMGESTRVARLSSDMYPLDEEAACDGECYDDSGEADEILAENEDPDTIDTMIVYTYRAMCAEANLAFPCEITPENKAPIEDRAALAAEEANSAYELSGVVGRQVLKHVAMVDDTYTNDETSTFQTMLNDLTGTDDGLIDEVHEWRQTYGADLVSMFVENGESCGLAWLYSGDASQGFSVVCRDCSTGYYSYGHEQSHNTGGHHDLGNCQGATAEFSFGYQDPQGKFRTMMSYDCPTRPCLRIPRFSSPNVTFQGQSLGDETTDNVRKLNYRWNEIAAFVNKAEGTASPGDAPTSSPDDAPTSSARAFSVTVFAATMGLLAAAWISNI